MDKEKRRGYYNNVVQELMIKDTPGYREMTRMTRDDFLEMLMLDFVAFALFSFTTRRFSGFNLPNFSKVHQSFILVRDKSGIRKQDAVSMDTSR